MATKKNLLGSLEIKLTPKEKKRVEVLRKGQGLFSEEFKKGEIKPFDRK